jgi:Fic family protein
MMAQSSYILPNLPPLNVDFEAPLLLKALVSAHRQLAELKGCVQSIPNQQILINTLVLQEAKASSEVESYITTQDELFQADLHIAENISIAAKEVSRYREALMFGFEQMQKQQGLLTNSTLITLFQKLKNSSESFRTKAGTKIINERTGEVIYTPPQDEAAVLHYMNELEQFINNVDQRGAMDPLLHMAVVHHQFESIHPFSDGNGRVGRIVCVLSLVQAGLLDVPVLYLSRYINRYKGDYYRLLQQVRDKQGSPQAWTDWFLFMLQAITQTAQQSIALVAGMRDLMANTKQRMREQLPTLYSQDLLNNLFRHPYTRIEFVEQDLNVTRQTAAKYLRQLVQIGLVREYTQGKHVYFINEPLIALLMQGEK